MHKLILKLTAALAMSAATLCHAATVGFDTDNLIDIDNSSNLASYSEAGFNLTGQAASFLTIDGVGTGMSGGLVLLGGNTLRLSADNGGLFSFSGLGAGLYDPAMAAMLKVTGIFGDSTQRTSVVTLGNFGHLDFAGLNGLSELRLSANADVVFDDLMLTASPVPEPGPAAMLLLGIGTLVAARRVAKARSAS